jgi:very-short-patch-repair endonuclease
MGMPMNDPIVHRARENRKAMPSAEARMWSMLRDRRLRYKFRRQHPIGNYVVDFACPVIHLVIEVDGPSHEQADQKAFDDAREAYLNERGWRLLRIKNVEVFQSARDVEEAIWRFLEPED